MKRFLLVCALAPLTTLASAAIIYDTVDATLEAEGEVTIDLDGDGDADFAFTAGGIGDALETVLEFGGDEMIMTVSEDSWDIVRALADDFTIDATGTWESLGDAYIDPDWAEDAFPQYEEVYLGARFPIAGAQHYGWIRIMYTGDSVIFYDFAYEDVAGAAIDAGDEGEGEVVFVESISVSTEGDVGAIDTESGTLQMLATVLPEDATDATYTWSVDDENIAAIDDNGLLTATGNGEVFVSATSNDGEAVGSTSITITNQAGETVLVQEITVTSTNGESSIDVLAGTLQLQAAILPENATDQNITWDIIAITGSATIDQNGLVTATGNGNIFARATANDGSETAASFSITITNQDNSISEGKIRTNLSFYPNPATDFITFQDLPHTANRAVVFDLQGKQVFTVSLDSTAKISVAELSKGSYVVKIQDVLRQEIGRTRLLK